MTMSGMHTTEWPGRGRKLNPPTPYFGLDLTNTLEWFLLSALIYEEELSSVYTLPYRMLEMQAGLTDVDYVK